MFWVQRDFKMFAGNMRSIILFEKWFTSFCLWILKSDHKWVSCTEARRDKWGNLFLNLIKINIFPPVLNVPTWLDTRCPLWSKWILQKQTQFFFFNLFPQIVKFFLKILPIILFYFGEFFFFFNLKMCKIK